MESSRVSFSSSSCSSSFSSLDCNKPAQSETTFELSKYAERPLQNMSKIHDFDANVRSIASPHRDPPIPHGRQSLDFRDVVKDSIYRDARGLSVKTVKKEEPVNNVMKHRDSPRPFHLSKSVDEAYILGADGKQRVPVDLNESLKVLAKLKEAPWYFNDPKETPRPSYEAKDGYSPRFSFDSKEAAKSTANKLRELPRLSLDSREGSLRSSNFDSKSNSNLKEFDRNINRGSKLQQDMEACNRPTGVVAKLMGLETLPNLQKMELTKPSPRDHEAYTPHRNNRPQERKRDDLPFSPKSSPSKPRTSVPDPVMKPMPSAIFPVEPAPWKQQEGRRGLQKAQFRPQEANARQYSQSAYNKIEKRLKELEFSQSNKDLRALKHILDSMQANGMLDGNRNASQSMPSPNRTKEKGNASPRPFDSPIVVMKPGKSIGANVIPSSSVVPISGLQGLRKLRTGDSNENKKVSTGSRMGKVQTPKAGLDKKTNSRLEESILHKPLHRTSQTPTKSQQLLRENNGSCVRSPSPSSPRLHQKKPETDKKSRLTTPSSETSKTPRRQASSARQNAESISPRGRQRQRPTDSGETRNSRHHGDEISVRSDSTASLASQVDLEVTSADRSTPGTRSPSSKAAHSAASALKQKKSSSPLNDDISPMELALATPEQPSPISVLDSSFYRDDLISSPVKKNTGAYRDDNIQNPGEIFLKERRNSVSLGGINNKKLENIEILVQKLQQLSTDPEDPPATDRIASLCDNENPDHRYISEILLSSGLLLRDLTTAPVQLHPSGHPINPDLFLVLEQTKSGRLLKAEPVSNKAPRTKTDQEKVHRKLIFDAVNENLIQKLALAGPNSEPWVQAVAVKLALRPPSGHRLLKELCSTIDQLQVSSLGCGSDDEVDSLRLILSEDMALRSESFSGVVLDIERSIFKDLIDEIVSGAASNSQAKASRRRRQLFAK
ncbi:Protein LONGIFOLIA 2 [Acorus calamus]|uniref:Protein LONGIFOLIA 2 n=1 Tax=Acorus calamus TaxID=4465 RepID=A0AAV9D547_ACOCL|nr:Protein LONGIFOLIA 2 [Acorus calamus]